VVTHDMHTVRRVADRVVMFYPLSRLKSDDRQVIFDDTPQKIDEAKDPRVSQFVEGEAGERLMEMRKMSAMNGGQLV
jgi:phospholipid/cholesterol/gamma-HCH transport system ATP-binding protein